MAITINTLKINADATEITVDVICGVGQVFTSIKMWDTETFKDVSLQIDLNSLIVGAGNTEVFQINNTFISGDYYTDTYFIEFTTDEATDNVALGATGNFTAFHKCVLDLLLLADIGQCGLKTEQERDFVYISSIISTLEIAMINGYFTEGIKIINQLKDMCELCSDCSKYDDTELIGGAGFGTIDNSILLLS